MKKSDLKVGYLVEVRDGIDGNFGVIMRVKNRNELNICRYNDIGVANLSEYNEDLTCNESRSNFDIIRVWGYASTSKALTLETDTRELLWERKEKTKVTLELTDEQLEKIKEIINE